eukprot:3450405-Alexandrium_andersonii.AAC.1
MAPVKSHCRAGGSGRPPYELRSRQRTTRRITGFPPRAVGELIQDVDVHASVATPLITADGREHSLWVIRNVTRTQVAVLQVEAQDLGMNRA